MSEIAAGFTAPGPLDFFLPDFLGNRWDESGYLPILTKPALLLVLGAAVPFLLLLVASRRRAVVPGRVQTAGELGYELVRNSVARDVIGDATFLRWVPLLLSLFVFVLANNLFGIVPLLQFPPFARVSYAYGLAALVWTIYNAIGIRPKGLRGYLRDVCLPPGDIPTWIMPTLVPLEFLSKVVFRPVTLSLRLFANMFAGHLLVILFSTGAAYLILDATGPLTKPAGLMTLAFGIAIGLLEVVIACLQAYVFVLLAASYIAEAQGGH